MNEQNCVTEELCTARRNMDDERFARDKQRIEKVELRLYEIEKLLREVTECNTKLTLMVENLKENGEDHENRIVEIEKKPGTYWDKIMAGIIGAAVAALMAVVLKGVV